MEAYSGIDPSLFFKMVGTYANGRGASAHPSSSALPPPISPAALSPVNYSSTLANERVEVRALIKAIK